MPNSQDHPTLSSTPWSQVLKEHYCDRQLLNFQPSHPIPLNETDLWVVIHGFVQLTTVYDSGHWGLIGLIGPSLPFGRPLTLIEPFKAIPLSKVTAIKFHFREIEQSPILAQALIPEIKHRLQQTEFLLKIARNRNIKDRLRELIPFLKQELGHDSTAGTTMPIRLSHQQLAYMIGATRPTVSRLLKDLRQEGIYL